MLKICEDFSTEHSMQFSTDKNPIKSKTKCLYFSKKPRDQIPKVILNGKPLPWVENAKHLGNDLSNKITVNRVACDTSSDLLQKRAIFFGKVHELNQCFGYCDPRIICETIKVFATSFYGSILWQLNSAEHEKLTRSWNTTVKIIYDLPFGTHKRFVESLTNVPHLQSVLHSRFNGFVEGLINSSKCEVKIFMNTVKFDKSSRIGQNIDLLLTKYDATSLAELVSSKKKVQRLHVNELEENEELKINLIEEISLARKGLINLDFEKKVMEDILEQLCTE